MSTPAFSLDSLRVDAALYSFVNEEAIPDTGVQAEGFWQGLAAC